jgi:hypothetical protein
MVWGHLSEADDMGVQQRPVIQQLPLHIHVDLQQWITLLTKLSCSHAIFSAATAVAVPTFAPR